MKIDITEYGVMVITPETSTEAFALKAFRLQSTVLVNDFQRMEQEYIRGSKIVFLDKSSDGTVDVNQLQHKN